MVSDGVARISDVLGRGATAPQPRDAVAGGDGATGGTTSSPVQRRPQAKSVDGAVASTSLPVRPESMSASAGATDARATTGVASPGRSSAARPTTVADGPVRGWTVSVRDVTAAMAGEATTDVPAIDVDESLPVFTSGDHDVTPALLVRPQLPTQLVDLADTSHISTLDLMIDEFGRVQRVHLDSVRNNINEKMLLSAAKAWIFQPAMRDGRPVRYRMRVQLAE